ncbi:MULTISPECIES: hypothetical protein [unclassified Lentimicrobium]|uniref:hypothetical protein n=1 Tax=unclassified Lentimicrobium TaxID=2677434 RepID=UPI0015546521|nr:MULTISPECIES: hypothetical protein [unclassified Lentimicrobium]NPD44759.1 hypothetical protein [Lentimicrobium sp. S6]NPD83385.1 hypothetical protein [Lentimicrobium sp. L6]
MNSAIHQEVPVTEAPIKIYSEKVIWMFSVLFATIFGAVLLLQNLISIGKKRLAYSILGASILYTILTIFLVNIPKEPKASYVLILNMVGGFILVHVFQKRNFMDESIYPKKKFWQPLIISIMITIPFILAMIYA